MTWEDYVEGGWRERLDGVVDEWLGDSIDLGVDEDENLDDEDDEDDEVRLRIHFDQVHQRKTRSGEAWDWWRESINVGEGEEEIVDDEVRLQTQFDRLNKRER